MEKRLDLELARRTIRSRSKSYYLIIELGNRPNGNFQSELPPHGKRPNK